MRTLTTIAAALALAASVVPAHVSASPLPPREVRINMERLALLPAEEQQRVLEIKDRLDTLIAMDRSSLDPVQRKEVRSEWKDLKGEMKYYNRGGGVIYISAGALIIIILLLIIIL